MLPVECEHGVTVDGGDFCESKTCAQCEADYAARAAEARERKVRALENVLSEFDDAPYPKNLTKWARRVLDLIEEQEPAP